MTHSVNNPCRAICDSSKFHQPNSPLSYFISITMSQAQQPKIRIKIPKTLGKTMQRRSYGYQGSDVEKNHMRDPKKWVMLRKILVKKVGLMFCKVFGYKKTAETCSNGKVCSTVNGSSGCLADGKDEKIWENIRFNDIKSSRNYVKGEEKQSGNAAKEKRKQKRQLQANMDYNKQGPVTVKNFFNKKKNGFSFFGSNCRSSNSSANVIATTNFLIGKLECSPELPRVPTMITSQKLKIGEESGELCKKRILMGEKCRPLNNSGILQYDKDGILLPENIP